MTHETSYAQVAPPTVLFVLEGTLDADARARACLDRLTRASERHPHHSPRTCVVSSGNETEAWCLSNLERMPTAGTVTFDDAMAAAVLGQVAQADIARRQGTNAAEFMSTRHAIEPFFSHRAATPKSVGRRIRFARCRCLPPQFVLVSASVSELEAWQAAGGTGVLWETKAACRTGWDGPRARCGTRTKPVAQEIARIALDA